jgi:CheY-like chemotaxis protein
VANPNQRSSALATRPARTPVQGVRAKLGSLECALANLSVTGAMLRSRLAVAVGREAQLLIELPKAVTSTVRVVRCEPLDVALPGAAVWRKQEFALGVCFLDHHSDLTAALKGLARAGAVEHAQARILVLGKDDEVSALVDRTLAEAGYKPRVLTHPRYAVSTTKRIGAKALVLNLEIDQQSSARNVIDTVRADPATASLPIVLCARQTWLQPSHKTYLSDTRIRLLLVPFTPEELVATVDRAIQELN